MICLEVVPVVSSIFFFLLLKKTNTHSPFTFFKSSWRFAEWLKSIFMIIVSHVFHLMIMTNSVNTENTWCFRISTLNKFTFFSKFYGFYWNRIVFISFSQVILMKFWCGNFRTKNLLDMHTEIRIEYQILCVYSINSSHTDYWTLKLSLFVEQITFRSIKFSCHSLSVSIDKLCIYS